MLNNRYLVTSKLGEGGMGAVYKAQDRQLGNRLVAVKEMLPVKGEEKGSQDAAALAFKQEADMLAALQHPNLPSVYEHFEQDGRWYLVMSFIDGQNLSQYLSQQGNKLPVEEVLDIGIQLCSVLDYLHTCQPPIIFRDLNPRNIMRSSKGHLYLIDFGIARHFKIGKARDTIVAYSQGYTAPEQFGHAQTTVRSDIYSLGATLHHLISGNHPASTPFRFAPIPTFGQASLERLNRLLLSMVEMDDSRRPASMALVKQELQQVTALYVADQSQTQLANASSTSSYQGISSQPSSAHVQVQQPLRPSPQQPVTRIAEPSSKSNLSKSSQVPAQSQLPKRNSSRPSQVQAKPQPSKPNQSLSSRVGCVAGVAAVVGGIVGGVVSATIAEAIVSAIAEEASSVGGVVGDAVGGVVGGVVGGIVGGVVGAVVGTVVVVNKVVRGEGIAGAVLAVLAGTALAIFIGAAVGGLAAGAESAIARNAAVAVSVVGVAVAAAGGAAGSLAGLAVAGLAAALYHFQNKKR
jgi:serine/threonine protein kinase